jgi:hypothetical protein
MKFSDLTKWIGVCSKLQPSKEGFAGFALQKLVDGKQVTPEDDVSEKAKP